MSLCLRGGLLDLVLILNPLAKEICGFSIPIFETVTNTVGTLIYFDSRSLSWVNKRLPWFLVEIDLDNGLSEAIDVVNIGDHSFRQFVDFWWEPFWCHLCWQTRHLRSLCNRQIDSLKNSGFNTKPLLPKTNLKLSPFHKPWRTLFLLPFPFPLLLLLPNHPRFNL